VESGACFFMQIHAGFACITLYKAAGLKKASERQSTDLKKPLVVQRPWGINEPGGMQNHNGPASAVS